MFTNYILIRGQMQKSFNDKYRFTFTRRKGLHFLLANEYVLGVRLGPALRCVQCSQLLLEGQDLKIPHTRFVGL